MCDAVRCYCIIKRNFCFVFLDDAFFVAKADLNLPLPQPPKWNFMKNNLRCIVFVVLF